MTCRSSDLMMSIGSASLMLGTSQNAHPPGVSVMTRCRSVEALEYVLRSSGAMSWARRVNTSRVSYMWLQTLVSHLVNGSVANTT